MEIDKNQYKLLKTAYEDAKDKVDSFEFQGDVILVVYAKYLLEFLKHKYE